MKFFILVLLLIINIEDVVARDFYVRDEVNCQSSFCVTKVDEKPVTGDIRLFFPNGIVASNLEYKDGFLHGASSSYYANGKKYQQKIYVNGKLHGVSTRYYENGGLYIEEEFKNNVRDGMYRSYYKNGDAKSVETFVIGNKHGRCRKYYEGGNILSDLFYDNGKLIGGHCFMANGKRVDLTKDIDFYNKKGITPCDEPALKLH